MSSKIESALEQTTGLRTNRAITSNYARGPNDNHSPTNFLPMTVGSHQRNCRQASSIKYYGLEAISVPRGDHESFSTNARI